MPRRAVVLALSALMLTACGTTMLRPIYPQPAAPPPPPAPGAVQGHGAFRLASGQRVTCAGFSVALMPDLARYRQRIEALYGSTQPTMEPVSEVKARSARLAPSPDTAPIDSATCDAAGDFVFPNLAANSYFLIARVRVRPAQGAHDDFVILQRVAVQPGAVAIVSLAP